MSKRSPWTAGVATANITPPVGIALSGFAGRGPSQRLGDELYATALVVKDEKTRAAIVAVDLLYLDAAFVEQVCAEIARRTRIPAKHVLMCCTHTHYGPATGAFEADTVDTDEAAYMADLKFKLAGVVQEANSSLRAATAAVGYASSDIGVNRRERKPEGNIVLGQNPEGPIDREVVVVRVDRRNGEPLACLANFACHPVSQSGRARRISADFAGVACEVVEDLTGATCLFLQGACGNINPVMMEDTAEVPRRLGTMLGAQAVQAYESAAPIQAAPIRVA
ncbi:MAG: neutral/alkaline non-lysosomal ceramidase N-terminal domain-containing protein, partial [Armatimonadota bacterium]